MSTLDIHNENLRFYPNGEAVNQTDPESKSLRLKRQQPRTANLFDLRNNSGN